MKEYLIKRLAIPQDIIIVRKQGYELTELDFPEIPDDQLNHISGCLSRFRENKQNLNMTESGRFFLNDEEVVEYWLCRKGSDMALDFENQKRSRAFKR